MVGGKTKKAQESFARDTGRLRNRAPKEVKEALGIGSAKTKSKNTARLDLYEE